METLLDALREAIRLLFNLDPALVEIIGMTLRVTGSALLLAVVSRRRRARASPAVC